MLVVDCPSQAFMPALTSSPQLLDCASGAKRDRGALVVGAPGGGGGVFRQRGLGKGWICDQREDFIMAVGAWWQP